MKPDRFKKAAPPIFRWLLFALIFLSQVSAYAAAPTFASGYPKIDAAETKHSSLKLQVQTNETGKAYYVVLTGGSTEPTAAQIKAGQDDTGTYVDADKKGVLNLTADTEASSYVIGLAQPPAAYDIYVVAEDSTETLNTPVKVEVDLEATPADTTAPEFDTDNNFPKTVSVTQTTLDLRVKTNEAGNAHYVILGNGATEPTKAQIKNGQDDANNDIATEKKGTLSLTANTEANDSITGLEASTPYDIFVIAEDADGNVATISKVEVLTLASVAAPIFNKKEAANITGDAFDLTVQTDKDSTAYYVVLDNNAVDPSAAQVKAGQDNTGTAVSKTGNVALTANTDGTANITGLTATTNYDVFVMAEDASGNVSTTYKLDVLTIADTTAPTFASSYPKVDNIAQTTATLKVQTNEAGNAHYVVLADGATAPTDVKTHADKVTITLTADTEATSNLSGLTAATAYDIYVIAEDAAGNTTTANKLDLLTLATIDNTAPTIASSYPKIENIADTTADLKVKSNENGKAYYVVLANGSSAPTNVKTHANKVTINLTANTEATSTITGLTAASIYNVYVIVEDNAGNVTQAGTYPLTLQTTSSSNNGGGNTGGGNTGGSDTEPAALTGTLATHNKWRTMVGIADLTWSSKAATAAQNWANTIAGECQLRHGGLSDDDGTQYGQNIHWTSASSTTMERVVDAWASEKQYYNYSNNSCETGKVCGHYTQIVWANTTQVGCGQRQCSNGSVITVCNYTPPGNYVGQTPYPTPNVNVAPTISGTPATVVKVGYSYTFTPKASDDNGDSLTFSITNKPNWATFSTSTGTLNGTPNATGNYTGIQITVSDGQATNQIASFNIEVQTANRSPTISGTPRTQIDVGKDYEFTPTASDPDGDSLTFSISNKPDWAIFDSATGKLSGQPSDSQTGTSSDIEISVTDGNTTASLRPFSIVVNAAAALFTPSSLIVTASAGGVNPASQKLRVNYPNGYNRNNLWSYATVNASFAYINSALISSKWIEWNVSFNTKTLAVGLQRGSITIKTDSGDQTVPIAATILDTAELQLSRSKLSFGGVQNGDAPKKQKIRVSSSGSKILSWSTATNANWLTIEPSQGTTTKDVDIGINVSKLSDAGEHTATISFIDSESGATIDVPVTLNVVAANSEEVQLTALEVVQVIQDLNNSISLIADKPTFVRAHVNSTTGSRVDNVNAKLTGKNGDTVVFEISPSNAGASINVSDNPNRSKFNDSYFFELPKQFSTGNLTLEFAGVDKPFACADTGNDCKETVNFETIPAIDMKLVDIVWLRKLIAPTQKMRQAIPDNIYNIYPISTLNVTQSNIPFILNSRTSLRLLRRTIRGLFLMKYFDGPAAEKQYYYGVAGKFYGTVGISLRPGTLGAGAYIKGIDRKVFGHNLKLGYRSDRPCGKTVSGSTFSNRISPVTSGADAVYGFNAKTKRIYPPTTSDFMTKRTSSWISDYNYKCAIETLKARTRSAKSARSLRSSLINTGDNTVTINGLITGTNSGVIDNLVNGVATGSADAPTVGDYKMSLQTRDGSTELAAYPFGPVNINVGGDSDASGASESAYSLILPRPDNMKRIVLYDKNGTKLDERIASTNAPTVTVTAPNGGETINNDAGKLAVTWNASDADGDTLTYAIDYSLDGGTNWKPLVSGYDQKSIEIDVALLAGTSQAKFRVTADDSFNSGSDESDSVFTVQGKDPEVSITSPNNGDLFISGQSINFVGQANDKEDGKLTGTSLTWSSDRDGDLGTGESLSKLAEDLAEGTHTITLTATDSQNQTGTSTISINVYRERPASLPARFSVSEDNFTIGGYVNGGTATATLTISNAGDGSLTWSAASDANWLTFSETSGTAPSNIKLIANPAGLEVGVYSGNVILTSDIPGVIAKTIDVTFRVQEALPVAPPPVRRPDSDNTNDNQISEVNNDDNIIDGGTIPKDKTITGGTLRGNIINHGTLKDITFEGEELKGGTLAGKLTNKGVFTDVKFSENTEIQGGRLQGKIVGAANAKLDNLEIIANSQVSNVTLGKNVTFGADVTLKDVRFMGASLSDVKLEGTIRTASSATVITNATLKAKAKVIGGKLAGIIKGDSAAPALLEFLTIEANSQVTNVIISDGVDIPADAKLGTGVKFTAAKNIPKNVDLTATLPGFIDSLAVDLSADLVVDGKGLLVTINDLPVFADNGWKMDQSDKTGNLKLKIEHLTFAVNPIKVIRVESNTRAADQPVRLGFGNSVYFTTDDGIEVEAHPVVQDLPTLEALLTAMKLPANFKISKEGNIQITVTDKLWFSGRAELASKPSEDAEAEVGFKFKDDLAVLVFEKDGQKLEQVLYPAPASNAAIIQLAEEASLTEEGILSFKIGETAYTGKLDYVVEKGEVTESGVTEIADSNGDGLPDFLMTYPQGDKQKLFALPPATE